MQDNNTKFSNIKISNFGIINTANIDITPLTVFIGPNSSGKSFLAKLIHCFSLSQDNFINLSKYFDKHMVDKFYEEINKKAINNSSKKIKIKLNEIFPLIQDSIVNFLTEIIEETITEQFDNQLDNLINYDKDFFEILIKNNVLIKNRGKELIFNLSLPMENKFFDNLLFSVDGDDMVIDVDSLLISKNKFQNELLKLITLIVFNNFNLGNSYYIPAERSEIIMDKKLLTRKILNKSDLSKNQSEVLANIVNIDISKRSPFFELGCELEREISEIIIDIKNENIFNEIVYIDSNLNREIPSKTISTSIYEITTFVLYLKYVLDKGDLLIIEEPEAHLHPQNQRILIKYISRAINQGLKVMFTTHSDYIIDQINNFINLNNISQDKLLSLNYEKQDIINYNDVNIYNFKKVSSNLFDVEKIKINQYGFTEDNFSKITTALYDETILINNLSIR